MVLSESGIIIYEAFLYFESLSEKLQDVKRREKERKT
jgi:hypothetical protein